MKKLIYALSAAACCSIATTACNTEFDDFDINTVEGIEALANSGDITESDFNTFVENAQSHILFYNGDFTTYYDNGVIRDEDYLLGSWDSPYLPIRQILFCPDRTGRVCFHYLDPMVHNGCLPPYNDVYIELEWSTNSKEKSIIFRDKKLQEEGCEFAVTSLTLKYYDKKTVYISWREFFLHRNLITNGLFSVICQKIQQRHMQIITKNMFMSKLTEQ